MKILSLLIAFTISLRWPSLARWRRYRWLLALPERLSGRFPEWTPFAAITLVALFAGGLASALAAASGGLFGLLVIGTVAVLYTLGPHSFDRDIEMASGSGSAEAVQVARERMQLPTGATGPQAAAASLQAALARWFGIVLWFALLGPAGCLLYRGVREAYHAEALSQGERSWMAHALSWLNWPVVALMVMAIALMTDLDRVRDVFMARPDRWQMPAALLDDLAQELCGPSEEISEGLYDGRRLAWRAMGIWLAFLSLLLLAGLLS